MKERIMNVKNILKIILMIFIIFNMVKSCSKAYTWEDFVDFCTYTKEYNINSTNSRINNKRNVFINRSAELKQQAISLGINPENYNSFLITESAGTSTQTCIAMFNTPEYSITNTTINFTSNVTFDCIFIHEYGNIRKYSTTTRSNNDNTIGLINGNPTGTYGNTILQEKWNYAVIQGNTDSFTNDMAPYGFYIGDVFIGGSQENKEIKLYINDVEQDVEIQTTQTESIGGYTYLTRVFKNNLVNGQTYNLRIYNQDNLIYKSEDFVIAWTGEETASGDSLPPSGAITNPSGDNTGNIDLTGITQGLENLNNAQKETTQAIISGDAENRNFAQKLYDDLFTIDSGDTEEIINNIKENTHIDNMGMAQEETEILNILTGEPSDFIIRWDGANYQGANIIPSGEINFSAYVREIPELQSVLDWTHIIMGYTVITVLITEIWFTILKILGVSTSIYDQQQEEIERLAREEEQYNWNVTETAVKTKKGIKRYTTARRKVRKE